MRRRELEQCYEIKLAASETTLALGGANVHSHQAMPGGVQPASLQVNGIPSDTRLHLATG